MPKPKVRRETEDGQEFERELKGEAKDGETEADHKLEEADKPTDRNISPLADGDPGSLLDLTA